jgi:mono/diheme cytochrome c family protein
MRRVAAGAVVCIALSGATAFGQGGDAERGNELYQYWCATCHGRGPGNPGTTALLAKYKKALPGVLEDRTDLTPQAIRFNVRMGTSIMPFFRKTEISESDLDAIALYLTRRAAARTGDVRKP